jgi:dihydroorotase
MKSFALINGKVVDTKTGKLDTVNLLIVNGKVAGIGYLPDEDDNLDVIDISGCVVIPEIIDSWAYTGEPKDNVREGFESVGNAAVTSGITTVALAAYGNQSIDSPELLEAYINKAKKECAATVLAVTSLTKENNGKQLAELGLLALAGAAAFTDGNSCINSAFMRNALKYSSMLNAAIFIAPSDSDLDIDGDMNEGHYSTILGLKGMPVASEEIRIARDIKLAEQYGGRLHFLISSAGSVELIKQAKEKGLNITAAVTPNHLYFTEADLDGYDTNLKIYPPLRTEQDQKALIQGLKDGVVDVITSQHTPCLLDEKRAEFNNAKIGISGIDLFLPLVLNKLFHQEKMSLADITKKISNNPLKLLNKKRTGIRLNSSPNFTVIDLGEERKIKETDILSKSKNTPFIGKKLKGFAKLTVVDGKICFNALPIKKAKDVSFTGDRHSSSSL